MGGSFRKTPTSGSVLTCPEFAFDFGHYLPLWLPGILIFQGSVTAFFIPCAAPWEGETGKGLCLFKPDLARDGPAELGQQDKGGCRGRRTQDCLEMKAGPIWGSFGTALPQLSPWYTDHWHSMLLFRISPGKHKLSPGKLNKEWEWMSRSRNASHTDFAKSRSLEQEQQSNPDPVRDCPFTKADMPKSACPP